jgi:exoribonuclease R
LVKRNRIEYWTLKYFQQHVGEEFSSIILDALKSKYRIIIKDFLFTAEIEREVGMDFSPGNEVNVCVKKADPWKNFLDLKFA